MGARATSPPTPEPRTDAQFQAAWMDQVGEVLTLSLRAHEQAKAARASGDQATAIAQTRTAYELRKAAHHLDPQHSAPIWASQQKETAPGEDTHLALMAFYTQQLGL